MADVVDIDLKGRYTGEISHCLRHGKGKYDYPGGVFSYSGQWIEGDKRGSNGEFTIKNYSKYIGDFTAGEITGRGLRTWEDGRSYEGDWVLGEMNGKGVWKNSNGTIQYRGDFCNNQRHGQGRLLTYGCEYEGSFQNHKFDGAGSFSCPGGVRFLGHFSRGVIGGPGKVVWGNTSFYQGQWMQGGPDGSGVYSSADRSFSYIGVWREGHPIDTSEGIRLEYIPPADDGHTDKKGKKEVKKKPPPKKDKKDEHQLPSVPVIPGTALSKLSITTTVTRPASSQPNSKQARRSSMISQEKEKRRSIPGGGTPVVMMQLPFPSELCRWLKVCIRPVLTESASVDIPPIMGDPIPLWQRHPPTIQEVAASWGRFSPSCIRYIDGVDPMTNRKIVSDSRPITAGDQRSLILSEGETAYHALVADELRGTGESLSVVVDFQLHAYTIAEAVTSITSYFVHQSNLPTNDQRPSSSSATGSKYTVISITSLTHRLQGVHGISGLELFLLVPNIVLEEYLEMEVYKKKKEATMKLETEGMDQDSDHHEEGGSNQTAADWEWRGCVWELRLTNIKKGKEISSVWEVEMDRDSTQEETPVRSELWDKQQLVRSPRYDPNTYKVLARWDDYSIFAGDWHSLALSLTSGFEYNPFIQESHRSSIQLVVDGSILSKCVSKSFNDRKDENEGIALGWIPETSFFKRAGPPPLSETTGSTTSGETAKTGDQSPDVIVKVGGAGFEGQVKVLAIYTELDFIDPVDLTSVYSSWITESRRIALLMEEDRKEEAAEAEARGEIIGEEQVAAVQLTQESKHTSHSSKGASSAKHPTGVSKHASKKGGHDSGHSTSRRGSGNSAHMKPLSPATEKLTLVGNKIPRYCSVVSDIRVVCRGGKGEVSNLFIPPSTPEGVYVVEVCDNITPECVTTDISSVTYPARPEDLPRICSAVKGIIPDYTLRFNVSPEA